MPELARVCHGPDHQAETQREPERNRIYLSSVPAKVDLGKSDTTRPIHRHAEELPKAEVSEELLKKELLAEKLLGHGAIGISCCHSSNVSRALQKSS
jgi:hypothetical protein